MPILFSCYPRKFPVSRCDFRYRGIVFVECDSAAVATEQLYMHRESLYRQDVEHVYVSLLLPFLNQDRLDLDIGWLVRTRLWSPLGNQLNNRQQALGLSLQEGLAIEYAVSQALLAYLWEVKQVQTYQLPVVGLDLLQYKQKVLGLQPETARLINTWLLPDAQRKELLAQSADQDCLRQYDYALVSAMGRESLPLKTETQRELQRLQIMLGVATEDVMRPEEIRSARQVDYTRLWRLLKAKQWRQADDETQRLVLQASGRQDYGWLSLLDLQIFPCVDLHTIDFLWMKFSDGRFGFNRQRQIWRRSQGMQQFAQNVGWFKDNAWISSAQLDCSPAAQPGQFPALPLMVADSYRANYMETLMQRLDECPMMAESG